jgi:hypothetical protein
MQGMRARLPTQAFYAFRNGTAGNHNKAPPLLIELGHLRDPLTNSLLIKPFAMIGQ